MKILFGSVTCQFVCTKVGDCAKYPKPCYDEKTLCEHVRIVGDFMVNKHKSISDIPQKCSMCGSPVDFDTISSGICESCNKPLVNVVYKV